MEEGGREGGLMMVWRKTVFDKRVTAACCWPCPSFVFFPPLPCFSLKNERAEVRKEGRKRGGAA